MAVLLNLFSIRNYINFVVGKKKREREKIKSEDGYSLPFNSWHEKILAALIILPQGVIKVELEICNFLFIYSFIF